MTTITAIVRNGLLELDAPLDLPDGTELSIPIPGNTDAEDAPMTAEAIERVLAILDRTPAMTMTDAELTAWEADRQARREWEKARFFERGDKLARAWE